MMVYAYNPSAQEWEVGGFRVGGQSRLHRDCLKKKKKVARYGWLTPIILDICEAEIQKISVPGQTREKCL
jgi:hypothetical protein